MHHPIELGNIVLIVVGIILIFSGPVIVYRTIRGIKLTKADPQMKRTWMTAGSDGLNFVIAFLFFCAGILFVLNNLRGNPLH